MKKKIESLTFKKIQKLKKLYIKYYNKKEEIENELKKISNIKMKKLIKSGKFKEAKLYIVNFYRDMAEVIPIVKILQFKEILLSEKRKDI
jgi:hypothetical protein